ncbi:MAG: AAA family ATPase, partial [Staphylococcus sp.]|nr:AAA family ATPase [Staphylococcus sp.]
TTVYAVHHTLEHVSRAVNAGRHVLLFIDEINRGNLSKIFGELFMLIENDKRGMEIELLYADEKFCVPDNVYIIGMMNTADRSLAILDYALRRRFAFFDMKPAFETIQFKQYQENLKNPQFEALIDAIEALNVDIREDDMLGEGFVIGHSYFSNIVNITESELSNIIEFEIIPLLKEYWFDDSSKVDIWKVRLRDAIQ